MRLAPGCRQHRPDPCWFHALADWPRTSRVQGQQCDLPSQAHSPSRSLPWGLLALFGPHIHFQTNHCGCRRKVSDCPGLSHGTGRGLSMNPRATWSYYQRIRNGSGCPRRPMCPLQGFSLARTFLWLGSLLRGLASGSRAWAEYVQPLTHAVSLPCRVHR